MRERIYELRKWRKDGGMMIMGYEMFRRLSTGYGVKHKPFRTELMQMLVDPG